MKLLIRWVISALALFAAAYFVPGIRVVGANAWTVYAVMAVILGLVNALVRPILRLLSCPFIILTLGLFLLIINGVSLLIAARLAEALGVGFYVDTFQAAFLGGLVVSVVTFFLNLFVKDKTEKVILQK
jgi:putative membrane protein